MLGITIGIGFGWGDVARRAAARMSEYTGLDCRVIDGWHGNQFEHPSWMKCKILNLFPSESEFLYFDADVWCMKPWSPKLIFETAERKFMAVTEPPHTAIDDECHKWRIPRHRYFNGGLLMFGRHHEEVFRLAQWAHPFGRWYEQTPLNMSIRDDSMVELDAKFNTLAHGGKVPENIGEVVNLHWCSCNSAEKVEALQKL